MTMPLFPSIEPAPNPRRMISADESDALALEHQRRKFAQYQIEVRDRSADLVPPPTGSSGFSAFAVPHEICVAQRGRVLSQGACGVLVLESTSRNLSLASALGWLTTPDFHYLRGKVILGKPQRWDVAVFRYDLAEFARQKAEDGEQQPSWFDEVSAWAESAEKSGATTLPKQVRSLAKTWQEKNQLEGMGYATSLAVIATFAAAERALKLRPDGH